jgi:hypothetical protein
VTVILPLQGASRRWLSPGLLTGGKASISKLSTNSGLTQLRLYFATDDNNNRLTDYMKFFSGNSTTNKPLLVITYSVP